MKSEKLILILLLISITKGLKLQTQTKLQQKQRQKKLPPLLKYHRCSPLASEQSSNSKLKVDTSSPVEGRFNLIRRIIENNKLNYERWVATNKDDGGSYYVKFYYKEDKSGLWQIKNKFSLAQRECDQLLGIHDTIGSAGLPHVHFEACTENDKEGGEGDSPIPYFNVFKTPQGQPLAHMCILNSCRTKLKKIAKYLMQGLLALSMGPTEFNEVQNITPDNIYYFENATDQFVTYTDMKVNEFPVIDKTKRPWKTDMESIGEMLTKMLSKKCDFSLSPSSKESPLNLYLQVHEDQNYLENDADVGVPVKILHSTGDHECATFVQKQEMLRPSIYDFIVKLMPGQQQFIDPGEALNHPYLAENKKKKIIIDRPSDV